MQALERRARHWIVGILTTLIVLIAAWLLSNAPTLQRTALSAALTAPLWLSLRPLMSARRRSYAWLTLALVPYLVFSITEAVANPAARAWASLCAVMSFALFVLAIVYLRVTRT